MYLTMPHQGHGCIPPQWGRNPHLWRADGFRLIQRNRVAPFVAPFENVRFGVVVPIETLNNVRESAEDASGKGRWGNGTNQIAGSVLRDCRLLEELRVLGHL